MKTCLTKEMRRMIVIVSMLAGVCWGAADARATCHIDYVLCPDCITESDGSFSASPGATLKFKAKPDGCSITDVTWTVTKKTSEGGDEWKKDFSFNTVKLSFSYTFTEVGQYEVHVRFDPEGAEQAVPLQIQNDDFTVNVIPSAGCTVLARDGGVDADADNDPDGNGIVCSGGMAANDPLCTEQFANSSIASLKVVPEPGYGFNGWIVNGAQIEMVSADPLLLTTLPALASLAIQLPVSSEGIVEGSCPAPSIAGKFRILGYEGQTEYEMALEEVSEGNNVFFRTLDGMRLHLSAAVANTNDIEEYSWSADHGKFFDGYSVNATELTGDALKSTDLKELYWEGEAGLELDATVTLQLKVKEASAPLVATRNMKSRVLKLIPDPEPRMYGDDVRMLQAFLRSIGISQKKGYGYRGNPVVIDGDFGLGTRRAVNRFRKYDQIGETGTVDVTALDKIKAHNVDYLIAFEAFDSAPQLTRNHTDYSAWLQDAASILATTYTPQVQQAVGQEVTPEKILDAFVQKETRNFGHWGYKVDYRISLSEDGYGSVGFSQILGKYKFGSKPADVLKDLNLYRPDDAIKIIAQWNNQEGGFTRAFVQEPSPYKQTDSYGQENRYPRIGEQYVDNKRDLLSKAIMAYNRGPKASHYSLTWPEMLRQYLPPGSETGFGQRTAINYSLLVQKFLIEKLDGFSWRIWKWTSQRIVSRKSGICNVVAHPDDEQLIAFEAEVQEGDILISPGKDGILNTQLNTSEQKEQALIEEFSFNYSEEQWLYDKDNGKAGVSWADVLLEEVLKKN